MAPARVPALDGLRGLAILLVFFHHSLQIPKGGYLGVDLFFVLSGFLISAGLLAELERRRSIDLWRFYKRRCCRLLPAFFAMIVLYLCVRYSFAPEQPTIGPRRFLMVLFATDIRITVPFLAHVWSLSLEWQFYFIWPVVLLLLTRLGVGARSVSVLCFSSFVVMWVFRGHLVFDVRVGGLLLGAGLAAAVARSPEGLFPKLGPVVGQVLLALALFATVAVAFASDYAASWIPVWVGYISVPLLCLVMLAIAIQSSGGIDRIFLQSPALLYFGRISYGLYLYHFPVVGVLYVHGYKPLQMMVVGLIVTVPIADCSWRYLEAPLIRWGHRRWSFDLPSWKLVRPVHAAHQNSQVAPVSGREAQSQRQ